MFHSITRHNAPWAGCKLTPVGAPCCRLPRPRRYLVGRSILRVTAWVSFRKMTGVYVAVSE